MWPRCNVPRRIVPRTRSIFLVGMGTKTRQRGIEIDRETETEAFLPQTDRSIYIYIYICRTRERKREGVAGNKKTLILVMNNMRAQKRGGYLSR